MAISGGIYINNISIVIEDKRIITDFTDHIADGEHVCLMGESGAGKSTLVSSIVGLKLCTSGSIIVDGLEVNSENIQKIRSVIAWVPQEINLPYETVQETLKAPYELKVNKHLRFDKEELFYYFDQVGLSHEIYNQYLSQISGGERQRLMFVSAIMLNKKIVLLDEPTSALDGATRGKLIRFLQTLNHTTILSITHDQEFADSFDRTITLKKIR